MSALRNYHATLSICVALCLSYIWNGPVEDPDHLTEFSDALTGVFQHGDLIHLLVNIALIALGGSVLEHNKGPGGVFALAAACVLIGTSLQYLIFGPKFIGASGCAYGFIGYALIAMRSREDLLLGWGIIAVLLGLEILYLSERIALATHISSTLIGGSFAMFGSLFGSKTPTLKPMQLTDVAQVVAIIAQTDEDDAAEAETGFLDDGIEGLFVLAKGGQVLGVTGYALDDQVSDVAWLSWTYLDQTHIGKGLGGQMLNELLGQLKDKGIRKLFIATSDYAENGQMIYANAHQMYEDFGARVELTIPDYHAPGEAKIIYGLDNPEFPSAVAQEPSPNTGLAITGSAKEPETQNVTGLCWNDAPAGISGLEFEMEKATAAKARMVVLAIPGDISAQHAKTLEAYHFVNCGVLKDYYTTGLHQNWWICRLPHSA